MLAMVGMPVLWLAGEEVIPVGGAGEVLVYQPGQEQQCAPGPIVAHDVLGLPGGVAGDRDDDADWLAVNLSGVVLEADRTGKNPWRIPGLCLVPDRAQLTMEISRMRVSATRPPGSWAVLVASW